MRRRWGFRGLPFFKRQFGVQKCFWFWVFALRFSSNEIENLSGVEMVLYCHFTSIPQTWIKFEWQFFHLFDSQPPWFLTNWFFSPNILTILLNVVSSVALRTVLLAGGSSQCQTSIITCVAWGLEPCKETAKICRVFSPDCARQIKQARRVWGLNLLNFFAQENLTDLTATMPFQKETTFLANFKMLKFEIRKNGQPGAWKIQRNGAAIVVVNMTWKILVPTCVANAKAMRLGRSGNAFHLPKPWYVSNRNHLAPSEQLLQSVHMPAGRSGISIDPRGSYPEVRGNPRHLGMWSSATDE